jgi:hypothetical protein
LHEKVLGDEGGVGVDGYGVVDVAGVAAGEGDDEGDLAFDGFGEDEFVAAAEAGDC